MAKWVHTLVQQHLVLIPVNFPPHFSFLVPHPSPALLQSSLQPLPTSLQQQRGLPAGSISQAQGYDSEMSAVNRLVMDTLPGGGMGSSAGGCAEGQGI